MKRRGQHPKHEGITHTDASLLGLTVDSESGMCVTKAQDGSGTIVGVLAVGYPACLPSLVSQCHHMQVGASVKSVNNRSISK